MDQEQITKARLKDLAKKAYNQNCYTYSNFLTPAELGWLADIRSDIAYIDYEIFGGGELCERQMVCFGSEEMFGYPSDYPISIVKVEPLIEKFSDELSHRDFLGSIMNLGIERNVLGDILVRDNKRAYIYCNSNIGDFICENLTKIRHTNVKCSILSLDENLSELKPVLENMKVIVASPRFDAIVAGVTKTSRNEAVNLFKSGKVTLNGLACEKNSMSLKPGDIFSVRGYGKFQYIDAGGETRKGRVYVNLARYT